MTVDEFSKKVSDSSFFDWINQNTHVVISFDYIDYEIKLEGVTAIYSYVNDQLLGWSAIPQNSTAEFISSTEFFTSVKNELIRFINELSRSTDPSYLWNRVNNAIINGRSRKVLPYNHPSTTFLIDIYTQKRGYFKSAFKVITRESNPIDGSINSLFGAIAAYEFVHKDKSGIVERRNKEKASLNILRSKFEQNLHESEKTFSSYIKTLDEMYNVHANELTTTNGKKAEEFDEWFSKTKEEWDPWFDETRERFVNLEKAYSEKLKLEEPAKFWENRAIKLKRQGQVSMNWLAVLIALACVSLALILVLTPKSMLENLFNGNAIAAIKWSVVYATLITFIAYLVRSLTKNMFSSFHLARDCEERHALTYFYLSLLKDSKVDDKDRQLIMQALFSRADTGLLKEDSSPTMPNDIISKILNNK